MDLPSRGGRAPGSQANGSFPKGTGRLSEKSPAGYPPPHHRDDTPGSAGVPPACCPFGCRLVSLRWCSRPPCRSRGRAPLPVDSGGGDGRSCGRICAGGTPALPGGLPPMTWSHQRDKSAEVFWRQLSLKEVHRCVLVPIRVHWWFVFKNYLQFLPRVIHPPGPNPPTGTSACSRTVRVAFSCLSGG